MADQSGTYYFLRFVQGWESHRIIHEKKQTSFNNRIEFRQKRLIQISGYILLNVTGVNERWTVDSNWICRRWYQHNASYLHEQAYISTRRRRTVSSRLDSSTSTPLITTVLIRSIVCWRFTIIVAFTSNYLCTTLFVCCHILDGNRLMTLAAYENVLFCGLLHFLCFLSRKY